MIFFGNAQLRLQIGSNMSPKPKKDYSHIIKTIRDSLGRIDEDESGGLWVYTDDLGLHEQLTEINFDMDLTFNSVLPGNPTYPVIIAFCAEFPQSLHKHLQAPTNNLIWFRREV